MVPRVGQKIGPYEILGRLGSGGMGLVFSAWDARLQRDVAIKILREEYASTDMRSRFLQEARAASGLNHPNICTIFDIGEQEGDPYLVMELLKGETLRARINLGSITQREILRVARDIADALTVAHGRGVIHRDIKPANIILVDKAGGTFGTKVLDFGLAKIDTGYEADSILDLTHTGTTVGTVSYMSPEQARGEALDVRSDLFSLGVMLYEMATGRLPFQGATSALVFVQLLGQAPDPIRPQNPLITEDLERLIMRLLEKDRHLRFQSAADVMDAVDAIPFGNSSRPGPLPSPPAVSVPVERRGNSTPVPIERRSAPRLFPRIPTPEGDPPTLPVRRPRPPGTSTPSHPAAPVAPPSAAPKADTTPPTRPGPSADEVLRPVRRIASSESSAYNLRATRESSALHPAAPQAVHDHASSAAIPISPQAPATPPPTSAPPARVSAQLVRPASSQAEIPPIALPRITSVRPAPRFSRIEDPVDDELPADSDILPVLSPDGDEPKPRMYLLLVGLLVMGIIGAIAWKLWPRPVPVAPARTLPVVLASVNNLTGDSVLSGAFSAGFEIDLAQSPQFLVQIPAMLTAGERVDGIPTDATSLDSIRRAARSIGATEIIFGEIRNSQGSYTVAFRINSVATGGEVLHGEESAQSREQLPDAIDRLVLDLRTGLGESGDSINRSALPLSKEGSSNLDALQAYAAGSAAIATGQTEEAAASFEHAVSLDPHFTQPYLRLADLYHQQHAQVAAASSATFAQSSSQSSSDRTQLLAQITYNLNTTGDVTAVVPLVQQVLDNFPNAIAARVHAAQSLQEQGKFQESLEIIQGALHRTPFHSGALSTAETALLAMGRTDAAVGMEDEAARSGHAHPDLKLLMAFLAAGEQGPIDTSADPTGHINLGVMQAGLLDATGSLASGLRLWQSVAAQAAARPQFLSAASDALSQAALNRALLNDCATSGTLVQQAGTYPESSEAIFRSALAGALCGNLDAARDAVTQLNRSYPQSFAARNAYVPELNAVIQWKSGDPATGLQTLQGVKQLDLITLAPYLRGLMHLQVGQSQVAVSDFQFALTHPGAAALVNPLLIPLSQIGLARAYAATGDRTNSNAAYTRFLSLWSSAEPGQMLLGEARANSH